MMKEEDTPKAGSTACQSCGSPRPSGSWRSQTTSGLFDIALTRAELRAGLAEVAKDIAAHAIALGPDRATLAGC